MKKIVNPTMHKGYGVEPVRGFCKIEFEDVAKWLESHGVDVDALSDGSGCGFEELMYGCNITDELCERIERESANVDVSET